MESVTLRCERGNIFSLSPLWERVPERSEGG